MTRVTKHKHRWIHYSAVLTAALMFAAVGCDTTETPDAELNREVEPVDPDADVEITPDGEADVDINPNVSN